MLHNSSRTLDESLVVTTRIQLQGYGLSRYQVTKITQKLNPVTKKGRAYVYLVSDAIASIRVTLSGYEGETTAPTRGEGGSLFDCVFGIIFHCFGSWQLA